MTNEEACPRRTVSWGDGGRAGRNEKHTDLPMEPHPLGTCSPGGQHIVQHNIYVDQATNRREGLSHYHTLHVRTYVQIALHNENSVDCLLLLLLLWLALWIDIIIINNPVWNIAPSIINWKLTFLFLVPWPLWTTTHNTITPPRGSSIFCMYL